MGVGGEQFVCALAGEEVERELGDDIRTAVGPLYFAVIEEVEPLAGARELIVELKQRGLAVVFASLDDLRRRRAHRRAGVTIAVRTGGFSRDELVEAGALAVFESIEELRARLDETVTGG
jgi:phosphoglycolate phosphatase-like HAD superfamily hydrolase